MRLEVLSRQALSLSVLGRECAITFPLKAINEALNKSTAVSLLVADYIHRQPTEEGEIGQKNCFVCLFLFCFCFVLFFRCFARFSSQYSNRVTMKRFDLLKRGEKKGIKTTR